MTDKTQVTTGTAMASELSEWAAWEKPAITNLLAQPPSFLPLLPVIAKSPTICKLGSIKKKKIIPYSKRDKIWSKYKQQIIQLSL